ICIHGGKTEYFVYTSEPQSNPAGRIRTRFERSACPGPVLVSALNFVNEKLTEITQNIDSNTILIVSAKHGQSPQNRKNLVRIDDGVIVDALNASWKSSNPNSGDLVAFAIDDDGVLLWLNVRSQKALNFATNFLMTYSGKGVGSDA